jgi:hypothetical protein
LRFKAFVLVPAIGMTCAIMAVNIVAYGDDDWWIAPAIIAGAIVRAADLSGNSGLSSRTRATDLARVGLPTPVHRVPIPW